MPIQDPLTPFTRMRAQGSYGPANHRLVLSRCTYPGPRLRREGLRELAGLPTCLLINSGKAKIEVRRLGMGPGKGTGDLELEVKDIP